MSRIIKMPEENPIITSCPECNTEFSFVLPEVTIKTWEVDGMINVRRLGMFSKEYWCNVYKHKKAVIFCPNCRNEITVKGYLEKSLELEKVSTRIVDKSEIIDISYC